MISERDFERLLLKHSMALITSCDKIISDWQRRTEQDGNDIVPDKDLMVSIGLMYFEMMSSLNKELKNIEGKKENEDPEPSEAE